MFEYILEIPLGAFFKTEVCKPIKNSGFVKKTTKKLGSLGTLQEVVKKGGVKKKEREKSSTQQSRKDGQEEKFGHNLRLPSG